MCDDAMNFDDAVRYVLADRSALLYSFTPTFGVKKKVVGGILYIIQYDFDEDLESEIDNLTVIYLGGKFNDVFSEEDTFPVSQVPKHAKTVKFRVSTIEPPHSFYSDDFDVTLKRLMGVAYDDALAENSCPECDQVLFSTGSPGKCERCKNG